MKRICVFAGSSVGNDQAYARQAQALGKVIAAGHLELVYGGSNAGLMAEVANAVLKRGGVAIGVMPTGLFRGEIVHTGLSQLIEVKDMHERKAVMGELADGYVALPGGYGTFEELFEVISWARLGIHKKPIGVLNVSGYFEPLLKMVDHASQAGFIQPSHQALILSATDPQTLIEKMRDYQPPEFRNKWQEPS